MSVMDLALRFTQAATHVLWVGALVALAVFSFERLCVRTAAGRHALCLIGLLLVALSLPVAFILTPGGAHRPAAVAGVNVGVMMPVTSAEVRFLSPPVVSPAANLHNPQTGRTVDNTRAPAPRKAAATFVNWERIAPWAASAYLTGLLGMLVRLGCGFTATARLRRRSEPVEAGIWSEALQRMSDKIKIHTRPALKWSRDVATPLIIGFAKPAILLPVALASRLSPGQVEAVLAHELAHLRRRDAWTLAVQRWVETLLFFHPAVWWISHRMSVAREEACDDLVVAAGCDPADYAEALVICSEYRLERNAPQGKLVPGLSATGNSRALLRRRVLRLIGGADDEAVRLGRTGWVLGLVLIGTLLILVSAGDAKSDGNANSILANQANVPIGERPATVSIEQKPFKEALAQICRQAGVELDLDQEGLKLSDFPIDTPVSLKCENESLQTAFAKVINSLKNRGIVPAYDVFWENRNGKFFVTTLKARGARENRFLPDWLKAMNNQGLALKLDEQNNVVSISVGAKASDEFLAKLATLPKLRDLDIEATKTITPAGLAHLAELPALEKLNLYMVNDSGDGLGDAALKALSDCKPLRDLGVNESSATDQGAQFLAGMTQLTSLSLRGNRLTDAGVKYLAGLTNLQKLDLSQSQWIHSDMRVSDEGMESLSKMTQLRSLSLGGLHNVTDAGLKFLSGLTHLQDFNFAGSGASARSLPFPGLQTLEFSGASVTDATLDNIAQYRDLRRLTLRYTSVTDAGLERVASLKELRQLTLDSHGITDAGVAHLKALPNLEYLWLRADDVSDATLASLAEIKSLTRLDLFGSGAPGAVSIGRAFTVDGLLQLKKLPNLRTLFINKLEFPEGCLQLRELKQLQELDFMFCNISDAEEDLLKAAMPGASVSVLRGWTTLKKREPIVLPDVSVRITGDGVDAQSGEPIQGCTLEFGAENPGKPGEVIWGAALPGSPMEVAENDRSYPGHFWGESFRPGKVWARLQSSGYEPTTLTSNPVTAPLLLTNQIVRMKRGG